MNAKKLLLTLVVTALMATMVCAQLSENSVSPKAKKLKDPMGAWTTVITPPDGPQFSSIMSFFADGNLVETANGGNPPALGNPGLGIWAKKGDREFAWTFLTYDYDANLQFIDTAKVQADISLSNSGDEFSARVQVTVLSPDGSVIFSGDGGTVQGTRVKLEPLQ